MGFDFEPYLSAFFPGGTYKTEPLSGGLVNFTVRASRTIPPINRGDGDNDDSDQDPPMTLVLKYAPPYVAAVGEEAPFSQDRQTVEATVLKLFSADSPLSHLNTANVRVPHFISHDTSRFVLAQEDLGPLITLYDLFSPSTVDSSPLDEASLRSRFKDIGGRLGQFFADVHSLDTLAAIIQQATDPGVEILQRSNTTGLVFDAAVRPVLQRLQTAGGFDSAMAERLYGRVCRDFERDAYPCENCLSMGDCHPGSVLISPRPLQEPSQRVDVAAIDWEFATIHNGRGVNGDMAQLLASLHLLMLSLPDKSTTQASLQSLVKELCETYSSRSATGSQMRAAQQEGDASRTVGDPVMGIFRSALILHGREMVNQAVEREWDNGSDVSVAEMVKAGAWYLERAGDNVEEMLESQNWGKLLEEEPSIMLALFGIRSTWK